MRTLLLSLTTTALLTTISGVSLAENNFYSRSDSHPLFEHDEFMVHTTGQVSETALSNMRGQGFQMPDVQIGVILWDDVDGINRPKGGVNHTGGAITVTVE